jgi:hypothetical protein
MNRASEPDDPLDETPSQQQRHLQFPDGHFYSPIVDFDDVSARCHEIWPVTASVRGIDFNDAAQRALLTNEFKRFMPDFDYPAVLDDVPDLEADPTRYFTDNSQFGWLDAPALFVLLRTWRPRRIIEVGSGFSSLLIADVNNRWLDGRIHFTCIEPYPRPFLKAKLPGVSRLIEERVQSVPLTEFDELDAGDILFIDSSHVSKTGSDVNFLYFQVLPRLKPGVHIHIHDIFFPHDYPPEWVIGERRSWNEQYIVHALLMYSSGFRVEFACNYAFNTFPELVGDALRLPNERAFGGASLWITKLV